MRSVKGGDVDGSVHLFHDILFTRVMCGQSFPMKWDFDVPLWFLTFNHPFLVPLMEALLCPRNLILVE